MSVHVFDGNAAQAIDFYAEALQASKVKKVQFKDIPQNPNYPLPAAELGDGVIDRVCRWENHAVRLPYMKPITGEVVKGNQVVINIVLEDHEALAAYFSNWCA